MMPHYTRTSATVNQTLWVSLSDLTWKSEGSMVPSMYVIPVPLGKTHYLLFQGLTGAIDVISKEDYLRLFCASGGRQISGGTPRMVGGPTRLLPSDRALIERGYFLTTDEESLLVERLNGQIAAEAAKEAMCFFLAPTNFCPVGCTYCIEAKSPKTAKRISLDTEQVALAFDAMTKLMKEYSRDNGFILLFGGEPMQPYSFDTVRDILDQCRQTGLKIFCFTSGLSLQRFAPMLGSYLDVLLGVCVTLDGRPELHNGNRSLLRGFELASTGINLLLAHRVPTMVRTNVTRDSFTEISWLRTFYKKRGWWDNDLCSFEINILTNHGNLPGQDAACPTHAELGSYFLDLVRDDPDYTKFRFLGIYSYLYYGAERLGLIRFDKSELGLHARVPRMYGCSSTGVFSFTLDADGSIRMCNEQVGSEDAPVGRYWPSFELERSKIQPWAQRTPDMINMCRECNHRYFCGGGCSLRSMRELGTTGHHNPYSSLGKGICGTLQADFQQFFGSVSAHILQR